MQRIVNEGVISDKPLVLSMKLILELEIVAKQNPIHKGALTRFFLSFQLFAQLHVHVK